MASFQIIVGSMLGGTEYVAEACEETLQSFGHDTQVHLQPVFNEIPTENQIWLVCTSTHGAGDYPDNLMNFVQDLKSSALDLSSMKYFTIGIGDSNYDTFCYAAINISKQIKSMGCDEIIPLKTIDMKEDIDPELYAQEWITLQKDRLI